jgi:hypothetical protein
MPDKGEMVAVDPLHAMTASNDCRRHVVDQRGIAEHRRRTLLAQDGVIARSRHTEHHGRTAASRSMGFVGKG